MSPAMVAEIDAHETFDRTPESVDELLDWASELLTRLEQRDGPKVTRDLH